MKILVLNGSPKREHSDTLHITHAFLEGMEEAGAQKVDVLHAIDQRIEYCTGCFACMHNGGTCFHDDDMRGILEKIIDSDLLILSFPLYCYGMPAPLKAIIDRTVALGKMTMKKVGDHFEHEGQADYSRKRYVMICGCGFPHAKHNFEGAELSFRLMFGPGSTVLTVPESPLFNIAEAKPVTEPYLKVVQQAGREYAKTGEISEETRQKLAVPMIPEDTYAQMVNQTMEG